MKSSLSALLLIALTLLVERAPARSEGCGGNLWPDTSMEVEVRVRARGDLAWQADAPAIMDAVTTVNGRVDGILSHTEIEELPSELRAALDHERPDLTSFDALSARVRHGLVAHVVKVRNLRFTNTRVVPGMLLKTMVRVRWTTARTFLGRSYAANVIHHVDVSSLLMAPRLELDDPLSFADAGLFEFHFRTNRLSAAALQHEVWTLLEGLGISKDKAHVHVVAPLTRARLQATSEQFALLDTFRMANLAAELISVSLKGLSIKTSNPQDWDALSGNKLARLSRQLQRYVERGEMPDADAFKMSYVGFHFPNKYDAADAFGFHFRTVDRRYATMFADLAAQTQRLLRREQLADEVHLRWFALNQRHRTLDETMRSLWYRDPTAPLRTSTWVTDFLNAHPDVKSELERAGLRAYEAPMIAYDWAQDPLFFMDLAAQSRVRDCQRAALERLALRAAYGVAITREFLTCADLLPRVLRRLRQ